jgi:adenylate cyclase class IV
MSTSHGQVPLPGVNIEIKARATDPVRQRELATAISDSPLERLEQKDTFFEVPHGRLKLREFGSGGAELIHYVRTGRAGPKRSEYSIVPVLDPSGLKRILDAVLGIRGVVRKTRHLYRVGRTRIHLDDVADLGWFIELEVVRSAGQPDEEGEAIARDLMKRLDIHDADLIECAYIDLLAGQRNESPA